MSRAILLLASCAVLAGCGSPGVEVRQVGAAHLDASDGTTAGRIAIGMGQLRLDNVALALETFRRASREDPSSAEALAGMAECYLRMGRTPLSRRYLEQALALRPGEPSLYRALARTMRAEGKTAEAALLEREAVRRAAPAVPTDRSTVRLALPAPRPAAPAPVPAPTPQRPAATVSVALAPVPSPSVEAVPAGPRLVRLSPGEIMLVSRDSTPFAKLVEQAVALADDTIHAPLRVLNAARIEGIAARTRALLAARGVEGMRIGNAPGRRETSELRYAAAERARADAVAERLPFAVRRVERPGPFLLVLGRDAAVRG